MPLDDVKTLLGTDDKRVEIVYEQVESRLMNRLKRALPDLLAIPLELKYVVDEVAIARFNRIGSEGMASETMDGHSATYNDDDFKPYEADIIDYINAHTQDTRRGVVRFI